MGNFEPADGQQARWKPLYELLKLVNTGDVLSYDEMGKALELDPLVDRGAIRVAMYRAAKELEEVDKRAVEVVANKGYRVVEPKQQLVLAKKQHTRSTKALARGHSKAVNVDLSNVDPEIRRAFEMVAGVMAMQMDFSRRAEKKLLNHDQVIEALVQKSDRSEAERDEMAARLKRLEERLGL